MTKKDYKEWSRDDLIREIEKLSKQKKFGLVWEEKEEDEVSKCKNSLPILTEVREKKIQNDKNDLRHIMIEGDNYQALSILRYTHEKKIDIIYIDPPYNTGKKKSWMYNDHYVEKDDPFRHSKWLSFMYRRLELAKFLLKEDGVLIISIDDNEQAYLGVMLDDLFKTFERHCVMVVHNPRGRFGKNFAYTHEYAFFVFPKLNEKIINKAFRNEEERDFRACGSASRRDTDKNCFYPIYIQDMKIVGFGDVCPQDFHPQQTVQEDDGTYAVYPIDSKGVERKWSYSRQTVDNIKDSLLIVSKKDCTFDIKRRTNEVERNFRVGGGASLRDTGKNCFYPIYIQDMKIVGFGDVCSKDFHPQQTVQEDDGTYAVYPICSKGIERKWSYARQTVDDVKDSLLVVPKKDCTFDIKRRTNEETYKTVVWRDSRFNVAVHGSKLLYSIIPEPCFPHPKSIHTILEFLRAADKGGESIILDFFAGSGTTGHAVLELNKEDGGNRQFILCTNNENYNGNGYGGVAEAVCYPRIKKVMNGYTDSKNGEEVDGLGGNLHYYKTDLVEQVRTDNDKRQLVGKITEIICLAENTFDKITVKENEYAIFQNSKQITGIIYDEDRITNFKQEMKRYNKKPVSIYVFNYNKTCDEEDFDDLENVQTVKAMPEGILNMYRKLQKKLGGS